jgi:hypothetical protein
MEIQMANTDITQLEGTVNKKVPILTLARKMGIPIASKSATVNFISCPVHSPGRLQKSPSCNLRATDNGWHCFSCEAGGKTVDLAAAFHKDWPREKVVQWLIETFKLAEEDPWLLDFLKKDAKEYELMVYFSTLKSSGELNRKLEDYNFPARSVRVDTPEVANTIFDLSEDHLTYSGPVANLPWEVVQIDEKPNYLAFFSEGNTIRPWGMWGINLGTFPVRSWAREIRKNGQELNNKEVPDNYPSPFIVRFYTENALDFLVLQDLKAPVSLGMWIPDTFELPKLKLIILAAIVYNPVDVMDFNLIQTAQKLHTEGAPILFRESGEPPPWDLLVDGSLKEHYIENAIKYSQNIKLLG